MDASGLLFKGVFFSFKKIRSQRKFKNLVRSNERFLGWFEERRSRREEGSVLAQTAEKMVVLIGTSVFDSAFPVGEADQNASVPRVGCGAGFEPYIRLDPNSKARFT